MPKSPVVAVSPAAEIFSVFRVSSGHVSEQDRATLRASGYDRGESLWIVNPVGPNGECLDVLIEEGVYGIDDDELMVGASADFANLVALARAANCPWLRLHPDGPIVKGLPVFLGS